jgi:hypothetical protein
LADIWRGGQAHDRSAASSQEQQQFNAISLDLDAMRPGISGFATDIATNQEQMTRSFDPLTAGHKQMAREIGRLHAVEQSVLLIPSHVTFQLGVGARACSNQQLFLANAGWQAGGVPATRSENTGQPDIGAARLGEREPAPLRAAALSGVTGRRE